jgi:CubicO group peptidase (beta-lactamase class C family)
MKIYRTVQLVLLGLIITLSSCKDNSNNIASSESVGLSSDTLKVAESRMQAYVDNGKLAGISTLVVKDGKIVQRANFGFADLETQKPIEDNTIFRIFSMTKPVTAVALMTLYDEGKFNLDDNVSKYIPEFKDTKVYQKGGDSFQLVPQENEITIRHLLTHSSGLSYGWSKSYVDSLYWATGANGWDGVLAEKVKTLAGLPLNFQPGTQYCYGLSIDVAGYLVEVLSGMPLDDYFKIRIFNPLKMDDTGFYVPKEKLDRFSDVFHYNKEDKLAGADAYYKKAFKNSVTMFSGGGGLVSTIDDYAHFCMMLLNGGELDGVRVLSKETAQMIMSNQLPENVKYGKSNTYALGGAIDIETREYSWAGMASTNFWIDPSNRMIVITYAQLIPSDHSYAYAFKDLVMRALKQE